MEAKVTFTSASGLKLAEAEFFFRLMTVNQNNILTFRYYVSAFLSALTSCTEHQRLFSTHPGFKAWFNSVKQSYFKNPDWRQLRELRRKEIHLGGTPTTASLMFIGPDAATDTRNFLTPEEAVVVWSRTDTGEPKLFVSTSDWQWKEPGSPKVMDLCERGLKLMQELVTEYDALGFCESPVDNISLNLNSPLPKPPSQE